MWVILSTIYKDLTLKIWEKYIEIKVSSLSYLLNTMYYV